jgi:hypothetical protein
MPQEMPLYVCHKRVRALEIQVIGSYNKDEGDDKLRRRIALKYPDGEFLTVNIEAELFTRYMPMPGDFYVIYDDDYRSFSPRKAFLEGYSLASEQNVLMERLNDVSMAGSGVAPTWLAGDDFVQQLARVAREAYVTINSLKHQLETRDRENTKTRTEPDQA